MFTLRIKPVYHEYECPKCFQNVIYFGTYSCSMCGSFIDIGIDYLTESIDERLAYYSTKGVGYYVSKSESS